MQTYARLGRKYSVEDASEGVAEAARMEESVFDKALRQNMRQKTACDHFWLPLEVEVESTASFVGGHSTVRNLRVSKIYCARCLEVLDK